MNNNNFIKQATLAIVFLLLYSATIGQNKIPPGGSEVLGTDIFGSMKLNINSGKASVTTVDVIGQSFKTAAQLSTTERGLNMWDIQWSGYSKSEVAKGDVILLSFYGRTVSTKDETGQGTLGCVFEKSGPDYDKSLYRILNLDKEWKLYYWPFVMLDNYGPAEAQLNFQISTDKQQVIELAEIKLYNYKNKIERDSLPKTEYTYIGRAADAEWRKKANDNIEKYRKANINFSLVNNEGVSVPGYEVEFKMTKHAFGWGTAIDAALFLRDEQYSTKFYENFNKFVFENDMKWPEWNFESNRENVFKVLDTTSKRGVTARGHCLVWPGWRWLPSELRYYEKDTAVLKKKISKRINNAVTAIGDKVVDWDVLNEPYTNTDITNLCGNKVMIDWFTETKKLNKTSTLYINDFSIIEGGGTDIAHQEHYYNTIKYLKENNAPIEGIGYQSHFAWAMTSPETVWKILDRYSEFGLKMQVTEFDIDVDDEKLQADYTRDFMTTIFAYPAMKDFIIWGFWESKHWKPNAAMYRADWSEKPNLLVWRELIYKKWWTNTSVKSTEKGIAFTRGFLGEYTYTIKNQKGKVVETGVFNLDEKGVDKQIKVKYKVK